MTTTPPAESASTPSDGDLGRHIVVFNPLPATLAHYSLQVQATLARIGWSSEVVEPETSIEDPSAPVLHRARAHLRARASLGGSTQTLVVWPAFWWLEVPLWLRTRGYSARILVHDPIPLRRQHGADSVSRAVASLVLRAPWRGRPTLVCHTPDAATAAAAELGCEVDAVCLHPILSVRGDTATSERTGVALVAGQFKPTRDVELLRALARPLRDSGLRPRIVGRGWPEIPGWEIVDEFVTEARLTDELRRASIFLLPYRRYWQSNVAVRALEVGTPIVGAETGFLKLLLGDDYPFPQEAAHAEAWVDCLRQVLGTGSAFDARRRDYERRVDASWKASMTTTERSR